jgi:hypothetical protein
LLENLELVSSFEKNVRTLIFVFSPGSRENVLTIPAGA